jgi:hypothetical protein
VLCLEQARYTVRERSLMRGDVPRIHRRGI